MKQGDFILTDFFGTWFLAAKLQFPEISSRVSPDSIKWFLFPE
jgi:hypothetical protein